MPQKTSASRVDQVQEEMPRQALVGQPDTVVWRHHTILLVFTGLWGANFILAEVALREMTPIAFSVSRFAMAAVAMMVIIYVQMRRAGRRMLPAVARQDRVRLVLVSVLGALLAPWLGIEGLALSTGARASLWLALGPVMSVAFGLLMRTERVGPIGYLGIALAMLGSVLLALDGFRSSTNYWSGDVLLFMALLAAVAELHVIKPLASRYGPAPVVAMRTAIGCGLYILIASPALIDQPWLAFGAWTWIAIVVGGAIGIGAGQWVKVRALDAIGPTRVILYGNLVPVAALVLAWLALGSAPSLLETLAAALIVLGAVSLQVRESRILRTFAATESTI